MVFFSFEIKQNAQRKEVTKLCAFEHHLKLAQEIRNKWGEVGQVISWV
jgi:hypothetical protein